jgi:FkbM family methyltransferase
MLIDFRKLFPRYNIKPKGVLHLGANVGEEAPVYDELGIERVFWVEGNPEIFYKLQDNLRNYPGQLCENWCVGNDNKKTRLNISNNGSQSSSVLELGTHKIAHPEVHYTHAVDVDMVRLEDVPQWYFDKLDFLNLDLQGFELHALRGMGNLLSNFKWIYSEVNAQELYKGCVLVNDLDLFLNGFGFKRVETQWCGNTGWGDALYIHRSVMP